MLQINVKADFSRVTALLSGMARQIPFATASALTATAKDMQAALTREIDTAFDRPVEYTRRGVGITPARKDTLQAVVFLKRKQAAYLEAEIKGGARRRRPFEAKFGTDLAQQIRAALPGRGAALDASGNIKRAQIARLARQAKAKGGKVFAAPAGGTLPPGIYERTGQKLKALLLFSDQPARYRKRFDFYGIGQRVALQRFQPNFERAFQRAVATAR